VPESTKPNLSKFFSRPTDEELLQLISTLPPDIQASLASATPEFLAGYLVGQDHAVMAIYSSSQAAAKGDARSAEVIRQRRDLITLIVARRLTGAASSLILVH
jgi:hypothetical protein